jgi:hypothetical protein
MMSPKLAVLAAGVAIGLAIAGGPPARGATLLGETIDAAINITGQDDHGSYTLAVFNGPITLGASDFSVDIPVFKQLTEGGFSTVSNQINGNVLIDISDHAITVTMTGQVQPYELESVFSGIGPTIVADQDSATGLLAGVNLDLFSNFTAHSLDFATFYLGFQPGTDVAQTEALTFGAPTPEPAGWLMMLAGFGGLGAALRARRRTASAFA